MYESARDYYYKNQRVFINVKVGTTSDGDTTVTTCIIYV